MSQTSQANAALRTAYLQSHPSQLNDRTSGSAQRVLMPIDKNNTGGLPLDVKILPQYFAEAGYQTSLIGKWHLGRAYRSLTRKYK